jgi:hypothetical protein
LRSETLYLRRQDIVMYVYSAIFVKKKKSSGAHRVTQNSVRGGGVRNCTKSNELLAVTR